MAFEDLLGLESKNVSIGVLEKEEIIGPERFVGHLEDKNPALDQGSGRIFRASSIRFNRASSTARCASRASILS